MDAPALAAPTALSAIWSGVTGRWGDILGVWIAPVTAQVIITLGIRPVFTEVVQLTPALLSLLAGALRTIMSSSETERGSSPDCSLPSSRPSMVST